MRVEGEELTMRSAIPFRCIARAAGLLMNIRSLLLLALVFAGSLGTVGAQESLEATAEAESATTFFEAIDVNIVNVDIVVVDRDGNRVPDLPADAFEVFEDGKPMKVTNFVEVREGVQEELQEEVFEALAENQPESDEGLVEFGHVEEPKGLQILLFVDNRSLVPARRNSVFRDLERFIQQDMEPGDRLMVVSFNTELQIDQKFSSDQELLLTVVRELEKAPTQAAFSGSTLRTLLQELGNIETRGGGLHASRGAAGIKASNVSREAAQFFQRVIHYGEEEHRATLRTIAALKESIAWMTAIEGKKAVLYLGEGITLRPGEMPMEILIDRLGSFMSGSQGGGKSRLAQLNTTEEIKSLTDYASSNRVAIYVIRPGGSVGSEISAEQSGESLGGSRTTSVGAATRAAAVMKESAEVMAGLTGGTSSTANFSQVIEGIQEDFKSYYSLAYTPPRSRDRRSHSIKVSLRDPKLSLRYRREYKDRSEDQILGDLARAAALIEAPTNPLEVQIEFEAGTKDEQGRIVVPVIVRLPISRLTLVPGERFHEGRLGFFVVATDSKGRSSPVVTKEVPIRVPNQELLSALGQLAGYRTTLMMREGDHVVAVGVQDRISRVSSAASAVYSPLRNSDGQ
jgi:VWFA-related protein